MKLNVFLKIAFMFQLKFSIKIVVYYLIADIPQSTTLPSRAAGPRPELHPEPQPVLGAGEGQHLHTDQEPQLPREGQTQEAAAAGPFVNIYPRYLRSFFILILSVIFFSKTFIVYGH